MVVEDLTICAHMFRYASSACAQQPDRRRVVLYCGHSSPHPLPNRNQLVLCRLSPCSQSKQECFVLKSLLIFLFKDLFSILKLSHLHPLGIRSYVLPQNMEVFKNCKFYQTENVGAVCRPFWTSGLAHRVFSKEKMWRN